MPLIRTRTSEEMKPIQGKIPDSVEEVRVATALYKLQVRFTYQWLPPIFRYGQRGSTVVDFLLHVPPLPIPLYVDGSYIHRDSVSQDELIRARLYQAMAGRIARPRGIPDFKLKDQAMADSAVRMIFGGF